MDCCSESSWAEEQARHGTGKESTKRGQCTYILYTIICADRRLMRLRCEVARMTIETLPDVVLLEIFGFYVDKEESTDEWYTLVHVCRKWRNVVFGSPLSLDLRLLCFSNTPVRETLGVWPPLPIVVLGSGHETWGMDNVIAALEQNDRIRRLELPNMTSSQLERVLDAMQQPFPALTRLWLGPINETAPVVPASFLGGSAPNLQSLWLDCIPFPGLPKLLMFSTHLVQLFLYEIPHSGYVSPESMVNCLSVLTRLEKLDIGFESPRSCPARKRQRSPPQALTVLPVLTQLWFKGVSEYLEELLARIDAPLLNNLWITFFHQLIFDTPLLAQFITRTPNFKAHNEAHVFFLDEEVSVTLPQISNEMLRLGISSRRTDWQLSSLAQVCRSSFPTFIPTVEHLYLLEDEFVDWQDDIENSQWLELLCQFTAVKHLYISWEFAPHFASILPKFVAEKGAEVLPTLQTLFMEEPESVHETIGKFVAARQLSSHPVAVSHWKR